MSQLGFGFECLIQGSGLGFNKWGLGLNVKNKARVWVLYLALNPCNQLVGFCKQVGLGV